MKLGLTGIVVAGSLGLGGCETFWEGMDPAFQMSPKFVQPGGYRDWKEQENKRQWININGRLGFMNPQGYGIVPNPADGGRTYYVYEYENEAWRGINRHIVLERKRDNFIVHFPDR